jgi:murein DD-endopeptidase MepM/ murein hydrolase activator NlpD
MKTFTPFKKALTLVMVLAVMLISCQSDSGSKKKKETGESTSADSAKTEVLEDKKSGYQKDEPAVSQSTTEIGLVQESDWPSIEIQKNMNFHAPLDGPLLLSGSFGELRGNHFHAGLDIRTGGHEGKNVYAIADGIVSRIKVSPRGYGKVLYIQHANGLSSVYGHLKKFNPEIQKYVEERQYARRSYAIELFPGRDIKVKKGQIIAISGNTGGSAGPHLHFEIRNATSGSTVNPILYGIPIIDKIRPNIYSYIVYEQDEKYRENHGVFPYVKRTSKSGTLKLPPGTYGFSSQNRDHQQDQMNKLGVNYTRLLANNKLIFRSDIEKFQFNKSRYIQMHYDYYMKVKTGLAFTKLFVDKKNSLPFYKHKNKGWLKLKQGDTINIVIEVADLAKFKRSIKFTIIGDSAAKALHRNKSKGGAKLIARSWKNSNYNTSDLGLDIPSKALYHNVEMDIYSSSNKHSKYSKLHHVHRNIAPLQTYYSLRIKVDDLNGSDPNKLLIVNVGKYGYEVSEGGTYSAGWMKTKTRSFGNYYVDIDTVSPKIKVKISNRNIYVTASDNLAGIEKYIASIDDQWILLEYHPNMKKMIGVIPDWVKPGKHLFELKVWDTRNNKTYKKFNISIQ